MAAMLLGELIKELQKARDNPPLSISARAQDMDGEMDPSIVWEEALDKAIEILEKRKEEIAASARRSLGL